MIQYVQEKYGQYHVSGIVTFGHLLARAVARDVGRIIGFDEKTLNEISNLIPHQLGITLEEAYQNENLKHLFIKVIVMKNGLKLVKTRGLTTSYIYPCCRNNY